MTKLEVVKFVARLVVGAGTTSVTGSIIKNNATPKNLLDQVCVTGAAVVIGSMASEATKAHTDRRIDEIAAAIADIKKKSDDSVAAQA